MTSLIDKTKWYRNNTFPSQGIPSPHRLYVTRPQNGTKNAMSGVWSIPWRNIICRSF